MREGHNTDTWQGPTGAPSHGRGVQLPWALEIEGISKDTPASHQVYGSLLFSIQALQEGDPKAGTGTLHWPLSCPAECSECCTHQDKLLPSLGTLHHSCNSPQLLKLSTFLTKPLAEGVLHLWLVQAQSAGHKHTAQLREEQQSPVQHLVPPGTRSGTDQGFLSPPGASLPCPSYVTVHVEKHSPGQELPVPPAAQKEKDTDAALPAHSSQHLLRVLKVLLIAPRKADGFFSLV